MARRSLELNRENNAFKDLIWILNFTHNRHGKIFHNSENMKLA